MPQLMVVAAVVLAATGATGDNLSGFVGLTVAVVAGFLALARLSQRAVEDVDAFYSGVDTFHSDHDPESNPDDISNHHRPSTGGSSPEQAGDQVSTPESPDQPTKHAPPAELDRSPRGSEHEAGLEPADAGPLSPGVLLVNVALTQGLFGLVLAGGAIYFEVPPTAVGMTGDALSTGITALAVGAGVGLVLWVGNELASGLAKAVGVDYDEGLRALLAPEGARAWALLLGATLPVIAVVEEFIFRAAVIGATNAAFGTSPLALVVVSAVAFALGHGAQGRVGILVTGALGVALGSAFVVTDSLLVVVVAHYLVNAVEFVVHEGLGLPDPVWS